MCLLTNWLVHNFVSKNRWGWRVPGHSEPGVPFIRDVYVLRRKQSHCKQTLANITALLGCFCENSLISKGLSFLYPENNYKAIGSSKENLWFCKFKQQFKWTLKWIIFRRPRWQSPEVVWLKIVGNLKSGEIPESSLQCVYCTIIEPEGTLETKWQVPPYINEIWFSQKTSKNE